MTAETKNKIIDNITLVLNANNIQLALTNLHQLINLRLKLNFNKNEKGENQSEIEFPMIYGDESPFAQFIQKHQPNFEEYIILIIALAPHVKVDFFDELWKEHLPKSGEYPKIGGERENNSRAFIPTIETALFILAGQDLEKRFEIQTIFSNSHWLYSEGILILENVKLGDPFSSSRLIMSPEYIELFTIGNISKPTLGEKFPAQQIITSQEWSDLVLPETTLSQINELKIWVEHHETLMQKWGMHRKLKPGYRALFYGSPGTGKTLTASLLGKYTNKDVYRIDLSTIVSKFIGETEKNLSNLFAKAENKNWILFFDEADALFGKRTNVKDAHDKYANQEVSYLLQRVESYNGLVILASNFKNNIDDAFIRRFQSIIYFPIPSPSERIQLWKNAIPNQLKISTEIDFNHIARQYEITGSGIVNIIQYCCLQLLGKGSEILTREDLIKGIQREYNKEGKSLV